MRASGWPTFEPEFARALTAQGLKLRNDDAQVGELRLQDLLKDELARLLIGLIRLGAVRGGQPQTWREIPTAHADPARSNDRNREVGSSTDDSLSEFLAQLRSSFGATPLDDDATTGPVIDLTEELTEALVDKLAPGIREV